MTTLSWTINAVRCWPARGDSMPGHSGKTGKAPEAPAIDDYVDFVPSGWDASAIAAVRPLGRRRKSS